MRSFIDGKLLISNGILARLDNCTGMYCYHTGKLIVLLCLTYGDSILYMLLTLGDVRGAFYPTLTLWHSIFVRFHNLIATGLKSRNGFWDDERLFHETRRILTAVYQNIVFNEWLPPYVGLDVITRRNVSRPCNADQSFGFDFYDEHLDASNMNEFGVGVFRLFHTNTPVNINMYDKSRLSKNIILNDA